MSVVIPTYNGAPFIAETLRSVCEQTCRPTEILCVDDCSLDDTVEVVTRLSVHSPVPLRLLRMDKNSGGPAAPMNRGIQEAQGRFIAVLDQDDLMLPRRVEWSLAAFERFPDASLVFGNYMVFDQDGDIERSLSTRVYQPLRELSYDGTPSMAFLASEEWKLRLYLDSGIQRSCSNHFFPKSTWERVGGYRVEAGLASDYDFAVRAFDPGVVWLQDVVFRKREHCANACQTSAAQEAAVVALRARLADNFRGDARQRIDGEVALFEARRLRWLRRYGESRR